MSSLWFEDAYDRTHPLEKALESLREKLKDEKYAQRMYASFCNVVWIHSSCPTNYKQIQEDIWVKGDWVKEDWEWSISWRAAGGLVASLRDQNEGYLDFYCSGNEGHVDEEVAEDLKALGWEPDTDNHQRWENIRKNQEGVNELEY